MALTGCYAILKYIVVAVNLVFWLAGLAVLSVSIWLLADPTSYVQVIQDESSYYLVMYFLLGAGALMFIVGFLGCSGAYRESQCMLVSFFCFLLIILVAEIAAGAWAYSHSERLEEIVKNTVINTVQKEYGVIASRTETFDAIQQGMHCCGATGPSDWSNSVYNNKSNVDRNPIDMTMRSLMKMYSIPASCCATGGCDGKIQVEFTALMPSNIYKEGCVTKLIEFLVDNTHTVIAVGLVVGIVEILGLIFSIILCCAIRAIDRYKA